MPSAPVDVGNYGIKLNAKGQKLAVAPTDAGSYQAKLNASALALLQKANPNYSFSSVSGTINYTITPPAEKPGESNKPGESGKPSTPNNSPTNTGEANNGTANTDHSIQDNKHDSTSVMPHGVSHVENNVEDKQMNNNISETKQNKLPQTGNATNESLGLIGILLSGLGIFSLLGVKKRRKDK